jgi:hypothetical protein
MAVWALARLSRQRFETAREKLMTAETDSAVLEEWRAA